MAMETPDDEPPGTYVRQIRDFSFSRGMGGVNIQYVPQSSHSDRILQEYREIVLGRQPQTSRREDRFL